ncbi:MAG TPA: hypothetical protein DCS60_04170, partial [Opitutae bacterium]|nr:hypothetical protein [Opitutae bacterium]
DSAKLICSNFNYETTYSTQELISTPTGSLNPKTSGPFRNFEYHRGTSAAEPRLKNSRQQRT